MSGEDARQQSGTSDGPRLQRGKELQAGVVLLCLSAGTGKQDKIASSHSVSAVPAACPFLWGPGQGGDLAAHVPEQDEGERPPLGAFPWTDLFPCPGVCVCSCLRWSCAVAEQPLGSPGTPEAASSQEGHAVPLLGHFMGSMMPVDVTLPAGCWAEPPCLPCMGKHH